MLSFFRVVILGVDPGLRTTGYGAIRVENGSFSLIESGYIKTNSDLDTARRLGSLHKEFSHILQKINPDLVGIENVFSLIRYPRAGIVLGQVLGVLYISVFQKNIAYIDLTPKEVKNALVGYGNAKKVQIKKAVMKIMEQNKVKSSHASDAIAAAIAAYYRIKRNIDK
ncbi:MAG: crossover junction endodeoxyribonuclease RuvC [Deltaproteobacteria bacterium]|nr:crossover junction endodeoxyribonuclease RuvC [Deltaproteobacteria bacterium]